MTQNTAPDLCVSTDLSRYRRTHFETEVFLSRRNQQGINPQKKPASDYVNRSCHNSALSCAANHHRGIHADSGFSVRKANFWGTQGTQLGGGGASVRRVLGKALVRFAEPTNALHSIWTSTELAADNIVGLLLSKLLANAGFPLWLTNKIP